MKSQSIAQTKMCPTTNEHANWVTMIGVNRHNVQVKTTPSLVAKNPRICRFALWVGLDTSITRLVNESKAKLNTINDLIDKYIAATERNKDDYYYVGVSLNADGDYVAVDANSAYDKDSNKGFMLITRSLLREVYADKVKYALLGDDNYEDPLDSQWDEIKDIIVVNKIVESELAKYNAWNNDNTYDVTVSTMDNSITRTKHGVYGVWDILLDAYDDTIDEVAQAILSCDDVVACEFTYNEEGILDDTGDYHAMIYIMEQLKDKYGFSPPVGTSGFDREKSNATLLFRVRDIPALKDILSVAGNDFKEQLITRMSAGLTKKTDKLKVSTEVDELLLDETPVCDWRFETHENLVHAMIDGINHVSMTSYKQRAVSEG